MKKLIAALLFAISTAASAQVSVTINGQIAPGVYGQVTFGDRVPAPYVYGGPIIIAPQPGVVVAPIYLHVPFEHRRHWHRHCGYYNACGRPVYFVREDWMRDHYHSRHEHRKHKHDKHGHGHGHGKHDR